MQTVDVMCLPALLVANGNNYCGQWGQNLAGLLNIRSHPMNACPDGPLVTSAAELFNDIPPFAVERSAGGVFCHAAMPERSRNSCRHVSKSTAPLVASSIARAVSASGNRAPLLYRLTVTCVLAMAAAKSFWLTSSRDRYCFKEVA